MTTKNEDRQTPVHFTEPHYLCTLPAGAQIIAVGLRLILVFPDRPPCYLTPTGLQPIAVANDTAGCGV